MSDRPLKILISAGEASGDRLGAGLARALAARRSNLELVGMGGARMTEAGVRPILDASQVSVVGILEVLVHLREIRGAMRRLEQELRDDPPDLLIPIDFPDFNLRLAKRAARYDVPVVYFVSPQVWAWRRGRVRLIRRLVRRMLVLFPFELAFYEDANVPVSFVGHPAVETEAAAPREEVCGRLGLDPARPIVALLPGSRHSEVERLLPVLAGAAKLLRARRPEIQFLLPLASGLSRSRVGEVVREAGPEGICIHEGDFPELLSVCAAGAVASGTASLESAIAGLPIVVVYRMNPVTYALGRALVRLDNVALPNLVVGRRIVPELIQSECTPDNVADELERLLADDGSIRRRLDEVRRDLGGPGAFDRAAEAVLSEIAKIADAEPS